MVAGFLSHSLPVPRSCLLSLTFSYDCYLSLTGFSSSKEVLNVSHCLLWLLAVSQCLSGPTEFLHVSNCQLLLLAVSHYPTSPMELLHVFHCLPWLLPVSHCLFQFQSIAECLSLSSIVAGIPTPSLPSHGVVACLSHSPIVAGFLSLSLLSQEVATCLSLSLIFAGCLSLSLLVPWSFLTSLTVSCCLLSLYSIALGEILRNSQQQSKKVRDMQQLHSTQRDCERLPRTMGDNERYEVNPSN